MTRYFFRFLTGAALFAAPLSLVLLPATARAQAVPAKPAPKDSAAQPASLPIDGIAAVVGDQVVLISEVTAESLRRRSQGYPVKSREDFVKLETEVRDQLVEAELLVQKAKADKIEVNDAELTRSVDEQEKRIRVQFKIGVGIPSGAESQRLRIVRRVAEDADRSAATGQPAA